MMMERGQGAEFKGKSIDEIDVPLEAEEQNEDDSDIISQVDSFPRGEIPFKDILPLPTSSITETNTTKVLKTN